MKQELYNDNNDSLTKINDIKNNYLKNMLQVNDLCKTLHCTIEDINILNFNHKIISVIHNNQQYFPIWQIDSFGHLYDFIDKVINIIGIDNQWSLIQFFDTPSYLLDGISPINYLLKNNAKHNLIVTAAKHYNEQSY